MTVMLSVARGRSSRLAGTALLAAAFTTGPPGATALDYSNMSMTVVVVGRLAIRSTRRDELPDVLRVEASLPWSVEGADGLRRWAETSP